MPEHSPLAPYQLIVVPYETLFPEAARLARQNFFANPPYTPNNPSPLWIKSVAQTYARRRENGMYYSANTYALSVLDGKQKNSQIIVTSALPAEIVRSAVRIVARPGDDAKLNGLIRNGNLHVMPYHDGEAFPLTDVLQKAGVTPEKAIAFVQHPENTGKILASGMSVAAVDINGILTVKRPSEVSASVTETARLQK